MIPLVSHVLVATDGSAGAQAACRFAVDVASRYAAALTALHVANPVIEATFDHPRVMLRTETAAREYGKRVLEEARALAGSRVRFATDLVFGDPATEICERARHHHADLVVLGTRGLGGLDRLLLPSVSAAVVRRAPCSVLIVRAAGATPLFEPPPGADQPRRPA
jgi:nucleotide-binding universal stress UspA family protein